MKAFAAEDVKLGIFLAPMFFLHTGQALRTWEELVNDPKTVMGRHPMDFRLVEIGDFDDANARLEACSPHVVAVPGEYLKKQGVASADPRQLSM